jgi:hypothetical protein
MGYRFWLDMENVPHVLFFEPIVKRLRASGHEVELTCRNYSNMPKLASMYGLEAAVFGEHGGGSRVAKVTKGLSRSLQLATWARKRKFDLAIGFGSRTLPVACRLLGLPNVTAFDYEHVGAGIFGRFSNKIFVPEDVDPEILVSRGVPREKILQFPGLKEQVYTVGYEPDEDLAAVVGLDPSKVIAVMRPPATTAHYHNEKGEVTCQRILDRIAKDPSTQAVYVRRGEDTTFDDYLKHDNIFLLPKPMKGLDLIAGADLVISGGGTMVREAAAMGVPAYSTFAGKPGAVDDRLSRDGILTLIPNPEDADKLKLEKRDGTREVQAPDVLGFFVEQFVRIAGGK